MCLNGDLMWTLHHHHGGGGGGGGGIKKGGENPRGPVGIHDTEYEKRP